MEFEKSQLLHDHCCWIQQAVLYSSSFLSQKKDAALHVAAGKGMIDCLKLLLKKDADVNAVNEVSTLKTTLRIIF